jgi:hypothetical protein
VNKLSFGINDKQEIDHDLNNDAFIKRIETPYGGLGAVGARYHGGSLTADGSNPQLNLNRLSTLKKF